MEEIIQYQKPAPEPEVPEPEVPEPEGAVAAPQQARRRPGAVAIVVALLIVAVLVESVLLFKGDSDKRTRADVLEVSRRFLAILSTYTPATLESQKAKLL